MKIVLLETGKTKDGCIEKLASEYFGRIRHYVSFEVKTIADLKNTKNMSFDTIKKKEAELILKNVQNSDFLMLLDENGKTYSSIGFADQIQSILNMGLKQLVFVIGGPYGFDASVYNRANAKLSLSKMTFSHQIIRPIFAEQLYRAFTILKNEPYHHQ